MILPYRRDPSTKLLLHGDGSNGSTKILDECGHVITTGGTVQISSSQSVFGSTSIYCNGGVVTIPDSDDWTFGKNDFWISIRVKFASLPANKRYGLVCQRRLAPGDPYWTLIKHESGYLRFNAFNTGNITVANYNTQVINFNTTDWFAIDVIRLGSNFYMLVNGINQSLTVTTAIGSSVLENGTGTLLVGAEYDYTEFLVGYLDEVQIKKGIVSLLSKLPTRPYSLAHAE